MFQKIRYRLLFNNIFVIALVLAGSAIAVRLVFVRNLRQQLTNQLVTLGHSVAEEADFEDGRLRIEDDFLTQSLIDRHQSFEWFNLQKESVAKMGKYFPNTPLDQKTTVQILARNPPIQSVTLPILDESTGKVVGYMRISQLLDEFNETVFQLDIGLGVGMIVAIIFSSLGILWLNRQTMQPIEESFRRLKQFTADASHELRSPLMAISSNVEVSLKYSEGMRSEDRSAMIAVLSASEQMTRLTEDLLLLARTDQNSTMKLALVNLSEILKSLVQLYYPQAEKKQIELTETVKPDLFLQGDSAYLIRAFTNLLQNAIRYTPEGGKVWIEAKQLGNQLQIKINDTGVGIASQNLKNVFERFWRADQARNYDDVGSGLGLPITQAIVQQHGGSIEVTSKLGQGSCFTVFLPAGHAS